MLKQLAIKELRESLAILGLAVLAMLYLLGKTTGWQVTPWSNVNDVASVVPFLNIEFTTSLIFIGGCSAIALGLKQSAWENFGNRYYYLLHRPLAWNTVFLVKMLVGCVTLFLLISAAILIYGYWAAMPGNHATPFFWGMTMNAWRTCLSMPSIYLGAALSGIRPARWYGTRLLPLLGACLFVLLAIGMWSTIGWWLGMGILVALDAVLLALILATARLRDY